MRNIVVSIFDAAAGRMIAGVLNLSSAHPVAMVLILAVLAALVGATWLDLIRACPASPETPTRQGDAVDATAADHAGPDSTAAPAAR